MNLEAKQSEKRIDSQYYVEGYAMTWDRYELYEDYNGRKIYEQFDKRCFDKADMSDIIFQYDHEGRVYARKSNGTLIVEPDEHGLFIAADLSKSENSRNLYEEIANGLTTKMSWGFSLGEHDFDTTTNTIVHKSIKKIYDVSSVSLPANDGTEISARSEMLESEINKISEDIKKKEIQKKSLALKLKLEGIR